MGGLTENCNRVAAYKQQTRKVTAEQLEMYSDNAHTSACNFIEVKEGLVAG
jgi:hypothetical protein